MVRGCERRNGKACQRSNGHFSNPVNCNCCIFKWNWMLFTFRLSGFLISLVEGLSWNRWRRVARDTIYFNLKFVKIVESCGFKTRNRYVSNCKPCNICESLARICTEIAWYQLIFFRGNYFPQFLKGIAPLPGLSTTQRCKTHKTSLMKLFRS